MPYSTAQDLMFGSIPVPADVDKWITVADDEIDAGVGRLYVTPLTFPGDTVSRPGMLLIKRASAMLATGRAIMAIDSGSQEDNLHQYAAYLVKQGCKIIEDIVDGELTLPGVQLVNPESATTAPKIYNVDASSAVEDFFSNFQAPSVLDGEPIVPYWYPNYRGG